MSDLASGTQTAEPPRSRVFALSLLANGCFANLGMVPLISGCLWGVLRFVRTWEYRLAIRGSGEALAA